MNLLASLVELAAHRVINEVPGQTGRLALILLLLLHPCDKYNLGDYNAPKNAPDGKNAFERIDLRRVSGYLRRREDMANLRIVAGT
jgi:hypothetical protein